MTLEEFILSKENKYSVDRLDLLTPRELIHLISEALGDIIEDVVPPEDYLGHHGQG